MRMLERLSTFSLSPYSIIKEHLGKRRATQKIKQIEKVKEDLLFRSAYIGRDENCKADESSWPPTNNNENKIKYYTPTQPLIEQLRQSDLDNDPKSDLESDLDTDEAYPHSYICDVFWKVTLAEKRFEGGGENFDFDSLWPDNERLEELFRKVEQSRDPRRVFIELLRLTLRVGPVRVLQSLIEREVINKDFVFESGHGLLHLAQINGYKHADIYLSSIGATIDTKNDSDICSSSTNGNIPESEYTSGFGSLPKHNKQRCQNSVDSVDQNQRVPTPDIKERIFDLLERSQYWEEVQLIIQKYSFDVNQERNNEGNNAIHVATKHGLSHAAVILGLVKRYNARVDLPNATGCTPLMVAVCSKDDVTADLLLCVLGADVNYRNTDKGETALHIAARINLATLVSLLIRRGADVNVECGRGLRPDEQVGWTESCRLIREARLKKISYYRDCIIKGDLNLTNLNDLDLFMVDDLGDTLLMTAARHNQPAILRSLLKIRRSPIDAQNYKTGQTALSIAAGEGHVDIIHILIRSGAAPCIPDICGQFALHHAVMADHGEALSAMLEYKPCWQGLQRCLDLCRCRKTRYILSKTIARRQKQVVAPVLFEAASSGCVRKLVRILEEGDNINPENSAGDWPLYLAATKGHVDFVRFLHERGGDLCCQHVTTGNTPLQAACYGNHVTMVRILVEKYSEAGPHVNQTIINHINSEGKTALLIAAERGYMTIVDLLMKNGASVAILDPRGGLFRCQGYQGLQVMIEQARRLKVKSLLKALRSQHAIKLLQQSFNPDFDHNLRDDNGDTILMAACCQGKLDVVKFLLQSAVRCKPSLYEITPLLHTDQNTTPITTVPQPRPPHPKDSQSNTRTLPPRKLNLKAGSQSNRLTDSHGASVPVRASQSETRVQIDKEEVMSEEVDTDSAIDVDYCPSIQSSVPPCCEHSDLLLEDEGFFNCCADEESKEGSGHYADEYNNLYYRRLYYRHGAYNGSHVRTQSTKDGATALHRAIRSGDHAAIVNALLAADPDVINVSDVTGSTPLHLAVRLGRKHLTKFLLKESGIDVNLRTVEGHLADEQTDNQALRLMIQNTRQNQNGR